MPHTCSPRRQKNSFRKASTRTKVRSVVARRRLWLFVLLIGLVVFWSLGGQRDSIYGGEALDGWQRELFPGDGTGAMQFFPASSPMIHYVGRWTATPNRLRKDGTFPGVYFDITINSTSTLFLSLHNSASGAYTPRLNTTAENMADPKFGHLSFRARKPLQPTAPISLLARIDDEEYIFLPNSSALVKIRYKDLDPRISHQVRIIAPMVDESIGAMLEFQGLWLDKGGRLLRVEGTQLQSGDLEEEPSESNNATVWAKHRLGLSRLLNGQKLAQDTSKVEDIVKDSKEGKKKILEIMTDRPYLPKRNRDNGLEAEEGNDYLSGVMSWHYLLGDMFGVDHVTIGVDGMCLSQGCIGGTGEPAGLGDVFFRSGPPASQLFVYPWMFSSYIPDVMILELGSSDYQSFTVHEKEYNKTLWELSERFEDTYVGLVKAIRELAYASSLSASRLPSRAAPVSIPIFIMRPLRGEMEHATQEAVNRLRMDGDKSVFWLDTYGWLDVEDTISEEQDFYLDNSRAPATWRLTEKGTQKVAIFLHLHVCRYLASEGEKCAFLPPEVYQGKAYSPESDAFERHLGDAKEKKLKEIFWDGRERR
ncbi:MAG: hypothetical protein M1829_000298 [Trizodia sp. TS-e1964]|nr:MAG: hypothetical protein M1829_000298 [Trizodia sp. TS-e1964]